MFEYITYIIGGFRIAEKPDKNNEEKFHAIGKKTPRKDGIPKVTGKEKYSSDIQVKNMLYGRVLRSPYPHAKIKKIDTSEAEKMGAICLTPEDVPDKKYNERIVSTEETTYRDRKVLPDKALLVGDAIAAVAAKTQEKAEKALKSIKVEFEKLEPVLDPEKAAETDNPQLHEKIFIGDEEKQIKNNIATERDISVGNVNKGFENADHIFEDEFKTSRVYHAQLENKSTVCKPEPNDGITVWPTTQTIHNTRQLLGKIFNIPLDKVNVKRISIGGSFGSSIQTNTITPITVALALKAGKPVKIVSSREEDMYDHARYPSTIKLKYGVKENGEITAAEVETLVDIGAHNISARPLLGCMAGWMTSLYKVPNLEFKGKAVYTNKAPGCAMQGFGNPQVTFAVESMMDTIAKKLNKDPIDLRLMNYVGLGDTFWGQGPTVKSIIKSSGVGELLDKGSKKIGWEKRSPPGEKEGRYRKGIGMARGFHTSGTGAPTPGESVDYSSALIKINEDGTVDIVTALQDHGGGTLEAGAKIVAEEIGVPIKNVGLSPADTQTTAYDVCTHATRGVYVGGEAMRKAAEQAKEQLKEFASKILDVPAHAVKIKPDPESGEGKVYVEGVPEKTTTVGKVAQTARDHDWGTAASIVSHRAVDCPPAYSTQFVEVEVDTVTGEISLERAVLGNDAGNLINPNLARGQLHGGFYRGAGYALLEDTNYQKDTGKLINQGYFTDYKMLTPVDLPSNDDIETFFADTEEPTGPFGAKGIGESALNPVPAAISNAVFNAIGIRFKEIPMTPEKVLKALKEKEKEGK